MDTKSLSLSVFLLLWLSLNLSKVHAKSVNCPGPDCIFSESPKNVNDAFIGRKEAAISDSADTPSENNALNSNIPDPAEDTNIPDPAEDTNIPDPAEDTNNPDTAADNTSTTNAGTTTLTTKETTLDTTSTTNPDTTPASTATPAQDNANAALGLAPFTFLILSLTFSISALLMF